MSGYWLLLTTFAFLGAGLGAYHRTPLLDPSDTNGLPASALTNSPLRRVSPDVYVLGAVRLDKKNRTVTFPGKVNMTTGAVEYAVVHNTGKVHESVLSTEANPLHVHLARLLIGPRETNGAPNSVPTPPDLLGRRVTIWVDWSTAGKQNHVHLEELIYNILTKRSMTRGPWVYNGSRVVHGTFLAERDGSVVAIIADPDALVNSPRPGRDDDDIWQPNSSQVPPVGTPVDITIQLVESDKAHY